MTEQSSCITAVTCSFYLWKQYSKLSPLGIVWALYLHNFLESASLS